MMMDEMSRVQMAKAFQVAGGNVKKTKRRIERGNAQKDDGGEGSKVEPQCQEDG